MTERVLDVENEAMLKIVELEKQLMQTNKELDHIRVRRQTDRQEELGRSCLRVCNAHFHTCCICANVPCCF